MRRTRLLLLCGSVACAGGIGLLLAQPGCSPGQCSQSLLDPNTPSPALECAAGLLCYQGQCIRACSAGQERAQTCDGDGDCDGSRPNCIDGFCSACDQGEYCVPTLNICQQTIEINLDDIGRPPPPPPGAPKPPAPLDSGWIDGGLRLEKDAGEEVPIDVAVTHAGLIDIAQIEDRIGGVSRSLVNVTMLDVSEAAAPALVWRVDPWNDVSAGFEPVTETTIEEAVDQECVLNALQSYTGTVTFEQVDFGDINIDSATDFPNSISTRIEFIWDDILGEYVLFDPPVIPADLLRYSVLSPNEPHFLSVSSAGGELTGGSWPNPTPDLGEHVPFQLVPTADTLDMLTNGAMISIAQPSDLVVRWDRIATGSVPAENVVLRFRTGDYEVNCQIGESNGAIVVKAGLLSAFISAANIDANTTLPLYFERAYAQRLQVPPAADEIIDVAVRVRHTFIGRIRFQ